VARKQNFYKQISVPFWALSAFLILTFFTGGASRADVHSLIILRPAAVIFCSIALWSLRWNHINKNRFLFGMTAAIFALVVSHLIPLPPSIWGAIPGRAIITELDKAAELGAIWRPISMVPPATWNVFYSLFVPLAVLLFGVQLTQDERFRLIWLLIGFGLMSGFVGILQVIGDPHGPLYLYRVTNNGAAVGLFSNRNHQAILLAMLFPMLAVFASTGILNETQMKVRNYIAVAAGVIIIPLLLITGSRAGLITGALGFVAAFFIYQKPAIASGRNRKASTNGVSWFGGAIAIIILVSLTFLLSRAEALQRLFVGSQAEELRFQLWPHIAKMAWTYFPFGAGIGTFVEVYQIDERYDFLSPTYLNHAHNDWLELFMTAGLPALLLLVIATFAIVRFALNTLKNMPKDNPIILYYSLGLTIIMIGALGSISDYPLRTPAMACVFIIAVLWISIKPEQGDKNARNTR
jgi:O-antigen ligase